MKGVRSALCLSSHFLTSLTRFDGLLVLDDDLRRVGDARRHELDLLDVVFERRHRTVVFSGDRQFGDAVVDDLPPML